MPSRRQSQSHAEARPNPPITAVTCQHLDIVDEHSARRMDGDENFTWHIEFDEGLYVIHPRRCRIPRAYRTTHPGMRPAQSAVAHAGTEAWWPRRRLLGCIVYALIG
jgi:hypothetical protein